MNTNRKQSLEEKNDTSGYPDTYNLDKFVDHMKKNSTTNKRDIVVSYNLQKLNHLLKQQYQDNKLIKKFGPYTRSDDEFDGSTTNYNFSATFGQPYIQFDDKQSGLCKLTMKIIKSKCTVKSSDPKRKFPNSGKLIQNINLSAIIPLGVIEGTLQNTSQTKRIDKKSLDLIHMDKKLNKEYCIFLNFNNEQCKCNFFYEPKPKKDNKYHKYLLKIITEYFKNLAETRYILTSVNTKNYKVNSMTLRPYSFMFETKKISKDDGILSLYINCDPNFKNRSAPQFQLDGISSSPIPTGYGASIIFSNDFIRKYYKKQLEDQLKGYTIKLLKSDDKFSCIFKIYNNSNIKIPGSYKSIVNWGMIMPITAHCHNYEGVEIKVDEKTPFFLKIDFNSNIILDFKATETANWSEKITLYIEFYGKININIQVFKKTKMQYSNNRKFDDILLKLSKEDYQITIDGSSSLHGIIPTRIPDFYYNLLLKEYPIFDISLRGLDFFATTNVFFPGKKVIDIDQKVGLLTPNDFLLVGEMTDNLENKKHSNNPNISWPEKKGTDISWI